MVDHGSNSDGHGPMISQINGRTLLLFYYGNVNMGYQIVTYKDITDVIEKSHLLFFQTGGFTLSLIVVIDVYKRQVHIRRLRMKIEDDPQKPKMIQTVWGKGYRLG